MNFQIQAVLPEEYELIRGLNESETPHVSHLAEDEMRALAAEAFYFRKVVQGKSIAGFVIGLGEGADYASDNYQWFRKRYQSFFYLDRIVVSKDFRRQGVGRLLYQDVENFSRSRGLDWVTLEVNIRPPNPESMKYHEALGYLPVGEQDTEGGKKRVCLMAKKISE